MITSFPRLILAVGLLTALCPAPQAAQFVGPGTGGAEVLAQNRAFGATARRVLVIGAHPDDEDSQLLAVLTRGMGIETAYLSLTRGEGGQNLIGQELGPALGVLRTEELLAARRIDGARQFFTRAYDFGFSKSAASAFGFWPQDSLVHDVVAVIRSFRPQVVISIWQGTAADGHGQHQASGIVARLAWDAAGDSSRFPDAGPAWQPAKFYRSARGAAAGPGLLSFNTGALNQATGQSYRQLAARSRSQHQSQAQGAYQTPGPASTGVRLEARVPQLTGPDDSLFAGIGPLEVRDWQDSHRSATALAEAGVVLDAWVDRAEVVPGESVKGTINVWNTGQQELSGEPTILASPGWSIDQGACLQGYSVAPGQLYTCQFSATVEPGTAPTTPYYLRDSMLGAFYQWDWSRTDSRILPFQPPELQVSFKVRLGQDSLRAVRTVAARSLSQAVGELRRPVQIVPKVALTLAPERLIWPLNAARTRQFRVDLEQLSQGSSEVHLTLRLPEGWMLDSSRTIKLEGEGAKSSVAFQVSAPARVIAGDYQIEALALVGRDTLTQGITRVDYPYITPHNIVTQASTTVRMIDLTLPPAERRIGYLRGAADRVPEALLHSGLSLRLLQSAELQGSALDSLATLVIGPRAYELDQDLLAAHPRIINWVEQGGTLILQYQQYQFIQGGFAPRPMQFDRPADRVTEPTATVTLLDPRHPLLSVPNQIGAADFVGWVQERGLYFPSTWDDDWTPLLSMHDAGEPPRLGSLLYTTLGKGRVVYTGLSFFRELPAGVPGAWRLFMNLLTWGSR